MQAATLAVRQVLAQAKNPRTRLGRMSPTSVAYHAARAAIEAHREAMSASGGHVRVYSWDGGTGTNSIVRHAHGPDESCTADCDYSGIGGAGGGSPAGPFIAMGGSGATSAGGCAGGGGGPAR